MTEAIRSGGLDGVSIVTVSPLFVTVRAVAGLDSKYAFLIEPAGAGA